MEPVVAAEEPRTQDEIRLDALTAAWLDGYTGSADSALSLATSLGAAPHVRKALPRGPSHPSPADDTTWLGWCADTGVDPLAPRPHQITRWLAHTRNAQATGKISKSTRVHRFHAMSSFLKWCMEYDHITPVRLPSRNERKRHHVTGRHQEQTVGLPPEAVAALLWAAEHDDRPFITARRTAATPDQRRLRSTAVLSLLIGGGLRASELAGARYGDFWRHANGSGTIQIVAKGGRAAQRPIPPWAADAVDAYLTYGRVVRSGTTALQHTTRAPGRGRGDVPLITGDAGQRITRHTVAALVTRLACLPHADSDDPEEREHAEVLARLPRTPHGCPRVHPHQLRHAAAHLVLDQGGSIQDAKDLLGHLSLGSTQIYLDSRGNRAAEVAARLRKPGTRHEKGAS